MPNAEVNTQDPQAAEPCHCTTCGLPFTEDELAERLTHECPEGFLTPSAEPRGLLGSRVTQLEHDLRLLEREREDDCRLHNTAHDLLADRVKKLERHRTSARVRG